MRSGASQERSMLEYNANGDLGDANWMLRARETERLWWFHYRRVPNIFILRYKEVDRIEWRRVIKNKLRRATFRVKCSWFDLSRSPSIHLSLCYCSGIRYFDSRRVRSVSSSLGLRMIDDVMLTRALENVCGHFCGYDRIKWKKKKKKKYRYIDPSTFSLRDISR